jgi:hypothetical protein
MHNVSRRVILRRGIQALSVAALMPLSMRPALAASCSDSASESLRTSLNYKEESPSPAQTCSACAFFTAAGACGNCTIMSDNVSPKGHCDSWSAKS